MARTLEPRSNKILLTVLEPDSTSKGGLALPTFAAERNLGKVLAVGLSVAAVNVGDTVLFSPHAAVPVRFDETDYSILEEDDVHAIVRE